MYTNGNRHSIEESRSETRSAEVLPYFYRVIQWNNMAGDMVRINLVPRAGFEPARTEAHSLLRTACLPVSPPRPGW